MSQAIIPSDLYVSGAVACKSFVPPAGCVADAAVQAGAGIQATKLQHQYQPCFSQDSNVNAAAETKAIYTVQGATATIVGFAAGAIVPLTGNDTCTVDVRKNGVTILTAAVALASTDAARALKASSLATTTAVAGDVFEVVVTPTHNTGTLPQGVLARLVIQESAQ